MREEERFTLPCPISHLLIYVGYIIFGSIFLLQLWDALVDRATNSSLRKEAALLVALTENELHGRSKDEVLDLLGKTGRFVRESCRCLDYGGLDLFFQEGRFVVYDVDARNIGNSSTLNGPCTKPCRKEDFEQ